MAERYIPPEKLREFTLNDVVKRVIRSAISLKERSSDSETGFMSIAEFNFTQEIVKEIIEKAIKDGFTLREIIKKLKSGFNSDEFVLEPHEDRLNLTKFLQSCAVIDEGNEEDYKEKINTIIIKDIKETKSVAEPIRVNFSMVPPDDLPGPQGKKEKSFGDGVEKRTLPRIEELKSLLQNYDNMKEGDRYYRIEFDANLLEQKKQKKDKMRKKEYEMFVIPELQVMILVCDEEGNSTFVIRRPCLVKENLQQKMAGKNVDAIVGDDPLFYAGLKKSKLYSLERNEQNPDGVVIPVEWDDSQWADKILEALTRQIDDKQGLTFKEIGEVVKSKEEVYKYKIYEYLGGLDEQELRHINIETHYLFFLKVHSLGPTERIRYSFSACVFKYLEDKLGFSPRKLSEEFLSRFSDEELARLEIATIYRQFLKEYDISEGTWKENAFGMVFRELCRKKGIVRDVDVETANRDRVRSFLKSLNEDESLALTYRQLYSRLLAERIITADDLSEDQVRSLFDNFRKRRNIKKHSFADPEVRKKVIEFLDSAIDLTKSCEVLYKEFLLANGLTKEQYSYGAFSTRLTRVRKEAGIVLRDDREADLMKVFFNEFDNENPGGVADTDLDRFYRVFIKKYNLEPTADLYGRFQKNRWSYLEGMGVSSKRARQNKLVSDFVSGLNQDDLGMVKNFSDLDAKKLYNECLSVTGLKIEDYSFVAFQIKLRRTWRKLRKIKYEGIK